MFLKTLLKLKKMKITITREYDVPDVYPIYRASAQRNCHWYKVTEGQCIIVTNGYSSLSITAAHKELAWSIDDNIDVTEAEFLDAYEAVKNRLDALCL